MARRNPLNERYGKYTAPTGKTRKSAASAKPKRAVAEGTSSAKPARKPGRKPAAAASKRPAVVINPDTPEYKRWRTVWWVTLGGAVVFSALTWWLWQEADQRAIGNGVLVVGYLLIFASIIIDWTKLRPMRREWAEHGAKAAKKEPAKKEPAKKESTSGKDES